jgi:hypothetical protein
MWAEMLEEKGIHSMMKTYPSFGGISGEAVSSYIRPAIMQIEIYVLQSDAGRARDILDGISDGASSP